MATNISQEMTMNSTDPAALQPKGVWYFSGDLLFASRVKYAAESAGLAFSLLGKWPESPPSLPVWIIVDLATRSGGASAIAALAKEQQATAHLIAFGPHVDIAKLRNAREAGFGHVLTRSQFDAMLPTLFNRDLDELRDSDD